jgi:hypothetical protein
VSVPNLINKSRRQAFFSSLSFLRAVGGGGWEAARRGRAPKHPFSFSSKKSLLLKACFEKKACF